MKKILKGFAIVTFVCLAAALLAIQYVHSLMDKPLNLAEAAYILEIKKGDTLSRLAYRLSDEGMISHPRLFTLYGRYYGYATQIKTGEYQVVPGDTALVLLDKLKRGTVIRYSLTLIEGHTLKDFRKQLEDTPKLESVLSGVSSSEIMTKLGVPEHHFEGYFYPDTYYYQKGDSDYDILKRSFIRMNDVLTEEWKNRAEDLPYKTPYEALIMASIVEKETGQPSERAKIASVFVRRLQKKMRLQTDPTVIYGLQERYQGNLTRRHLREKTPYNTYRIFGLPPTPIANPGKDAIHAALHPEPTNALYFVARGDGSHYFSATLEEHQKAVRQYQLKKKKNYRSSPR